MPILFLFALLVLALNSCGQAPTTVRKTPVKLRQQTYKSLEEIGRFSRVVLLETREDVLLGDIGKVVVDPAGGDLLVSDMRINQAVFRFDASGQFLRQYGGKGFGPGEVQALYDFTLMDDGSVAITGENKLAIFAPDGALVTERLLPASGLWIIGRGDRLYVAGLDGIAGRDHLVTVFDRELNDVDSFITTDPRVDKVAFPPNGCLALCGDQLVVNHFYDLEIDLVDATQSRVETFSFPNHNDQLAAFWDGPAEQFRDRARLAVLFNGLHRFNRVLSIGDWLYLPEYAPALEGRGDTLFHPGDGTAIRLQGPGLVGDTEKAEDLVMTRLVGSFDQGAIGYLDNPALFDRHKKRLGSADLHFGETDNPVLMFFTFHATQQSPKPQGEHHE